MADYTDLWNAEWDAWADEVRLADPPLCRRDALRLLRSLNLLQRTGEISSAAHNHFLATGHKLTFGCCAKASREADTAA